MKSAKKKRKLLTRKKVVKRTIKAKPAPRKRRKSRMSNIKKPIEDEDTGPGKKGPAVDPMGTPPDSPPNPNLPPEPKPSPMPGPKPAAE